MGTNLDFSKVTNIVFDGINHKDYPDYCDAYISYAEYDGEEMTEEQIEMLYEDYDWVYEKLMSQIF